MHHCGHAHILSVPVSLQMCCCVDDRSLVQNGICIILVSLPPTVSSISSLTWLEDMRLEPVFIHWSMALLKPLEMAAKEELSRSLSSADTVGKTDNALWHNDIMLTDCAALCGTMIGTCMCLGQAVSWASPRIQLYAWMSRGHSEALACLCIHVKVV